MKYLFAASLLLLLSITTHAQTKSTETFKVYGNCGMCKKTIETAALDAKGVKSATWGIKVDMFTVVFDSSKTDLDKIKTAIAVSV
jgi:copper chaperone CopZ